MSAFLEILKAILFGIVEGVTEWLPISSTGHLILLNQFVNLSMSEEFLKMFNVVIQLGAILAVIVLFFKKLNPFSLYDAQKKYNNSWILGEKIAVSKRTMLLWAKVIVSIIPSGIVGVLFDDFLEEKLHGYVVVALMLIAYGVAFIYVEQKNKNKAPRIKRVHEIDWKTAILIGCFQCLSLIPGTSRSGSTILGGILLGVSRGAASEFSFFMAIPTMLGASAIKLLKFMVSGASAQATEIVVLIVGCVVSFVVSLYVIRALMDYVKKHSFSAFGVYRIVLGAVILVYWLATLGK